MHLSGGVRLSEARVSKLGATTRPTFILVSIINVEVIKTKTSFLALDSYWHNDAFSDN